MLYILDLIHNFFTGIEFQFSQPSYNVNMDSGVVNICLQLVNGMLNKDVVIELLVATSEEEMVFSKWI